MTATTHLPEMACQELVEAITDYLEGALEAVDARRFEEHLAVCAKCKQYMDQFSAVLAAAGRVRADQLSPELRSGLMDAFSDWRSSR